MRVWCTNWCSIFQEKMFVCWNINTLEVTFVLGCLKKNVRVHANVQDKMFIFGSYFYFWIFSPTVSPIFLSRPILYFTAMIIVYTLYSILHHVMCIQPILVFCNKTLLSINRVVDLFSLCDNFLLPLETCVLCTPI